MPKPRHSQHPEIRACCQCEYWIGAPMALSKNVTLPVLRECRVNAPMPVKTQTHGDYRAFPRTADHDHCGQFRPCTREAKPSMPTVPLEPPITTRSDEQT